MRVCPQHPHNHNLFASNMSIRREVSSTDDEISTPSEESSEESYEEEDNYNIDPDYVEEDSNESVCYFASSESTEIEMKNSMTSDNPSALKTVGRKRKHPDTLLKCNSWHQQQQSMNHTDTSSYMSVWTQERYQHLKNNIERIQKFCEEQFKLVRSNAKQELRYNDLNASRTSEIEQFKGNTKRNKRFGKIVIDRTQKKVDTERQKLKALDTLNEIFEAVSEVESFRDYLVKITLQKKL